MEDDAPKQEPDDTESQEESGNTPAVSVWITEDGYHTEIAADLNPITLAGIAWYLEKQAQRGMSMLLQAQQQAQGPGLFVPPGFTRDHKRKN
jgi:hypothetical protein